MRNFDYLKDIAELRDLYRYCDAAEATQKTDPDTCALKCRQALEWMVKAIYQLKHVAIPERAPLRELMSGEPFTQFVDDERLLREAHWVRRVGNIGAHEGGVKGRDAFFSLMNLYYFIGGVLLKLGVLSTLGEFDRNLIPGDTPIHVTTADTVALTPAPAAFVASVPQEKVNHPEPVSLPPSPISEAETRKVYIDLLLREAGWEVLTVKGEKGACKASVEIPVTGMPTPSGEGFVDYVLYGPDLKPLAILEAKKTSISIEAGRQQAKLYADCLELQYGYRPVIYLSNGYFTQIIDCLGYPSRSILGIHRMEDLQLMLQRRGRPDITDMKVREDITNRYYQKEAIHAVCNHFNGKHRRALLVMATGTGKTRVSISLCDVLMRNDWAKNILFLADRTALVKQAQRNFKKLLPDLHDTILNEGQKPDLSARIIFSTYQTMINYIDADEKDFSVGRFDLIIIDEAHRSIFGKYEAILDYFDALIVGLTATPRESVDKSTFDMFDLEDGHPNYNYDLDQAVADGYLVPPRWISRTTGFLKKGIKYDALSAEEKQQTERIWEYEQNDGRDIESRELFSYIYNKDTIDKVLNNLMTTGYRIDSNEKLGKTIIFAANHDHAVLIVERFHYLYPGLGEDFCQLIDNQVNYAQSLIDKFSDPKTLPQIAVSVDMLDTGIDVPEVVNLVFFKKIRSKIKFWQMVGRGTRLCPNVFGEGMDKKDFQLIDWCGNIEYFNQEEGQQPLPVISLSSRLFNLQLAIVVALQDAAYQVIPELKALRASLVPVLLEQVRELRDTQIGVRQHWELVSRFKQEKSWEAISTLDAGNIRDFLSPLLPMRTEDVNALRFDLLMYLQMLYLVDDAQKPPVKARTKVCRIADALLGLASIPQVQAKIPLLEEITHIEVLENANMSKLEEIRLEIRSLVRFLAGVQRPTFTLDIEDVIEGDTEIEGPRLTVSYKQRVMDFLRENRNLPVIQKLINLEQLTHADIIQLQTICWRELGTKEEYQAYVRECRMICGDEVGIFIRSIIGIDQDKALDLYSQFLSGTTLNPDQEEYLRAIIGYVSKNGDITRQMMANTQPFKDLDWQGRFGQSMGPLRSFIDRIHNVIVA